MIRPVPVPQRHDFVAAAWHHAAYGYHAAHHGSWIGHMVVSSLVHGLIYSAIFRAMRGMSASQAILIAVIVVGGLWLWNRNRRY